MTYEVGNPDVLIVAIVVLWVGQQVNRRFAFLQRNSIPAAVTGGLLCSGVIALLAVTLGWTVTFDLHLRDQLLLAFFATIGLGARFSMLRSGGTTLLLMVAAAFGLLVVQNAAGVGLAVLWGEHPAYGLMGGSVSLAGGHGTAIAWGEEARAAGLEGAAEFGIACATFGLIAGGLIGGPLAGRLIERHHLRPDPGAQPTPTPTPTPGEPEPGPTPASDPAPPANQFWAILGTLLAIAVCISLGEVVNRVLTGWDIKVPGFLTAMMVGIVIINLCDRFKATLDRRAIEMTGDITLQLFLSMSLMSMSLVTLAASARALLLVAVVQMTVITLFAFLIVFRLLGRNYDAAVVSGGFIGLGLGATPVAIANMDALTTKYGPSPKAFIVIPLVGAFFIDLLNAVVIKAFLGLPILQQPVAG